MKKLTAFLFAICLLTFSPVRATAGPADGPIVVINELVNSGSYTVDELLKIEGLTASCTLNDHPLNAKELKITRFSMTTIRKGGNAEAFFGAGNHFSTCLRESIQNLKSGDRVVIKDIYYKTATGESGACGDVVVYIK